MRILIIGNKQSNHVRKWANSFVSLGHDVMVLSKKETSGNDVTFDPRVKIVTMKYGGFKSYFLNVPEVRRYYKEYKPDVVNVHYISGFGLMACLANVRPLVLNCYGSDIFVAPRKNRFSKWLVSKILKNADAVAATSHAMAEEAKVLMDSTNKEITVTPFGVDPILFKKNETKTTNGHLVIGIIKYLKPEYNIPLLIKSFAIVKNKVNESLLLHIYGSGPLKSELVTLCDNLGVSECVTFYDTIPNQEVPNALNTMDIFVNCSNVESFGVNIVEAMSCGLPVVATPCPGPKEVIENGITGVILKGWDPNELAEELRKLIVDPCLREKYGRNGREKVLREYDWSKNVNTLLDVYRTVINHTK